VTWKVVYTKQAQKDAKKLASSGLKSKAEVLIDILKEDPYQSPPSFEKLIGDLSGAYSRRINIQYRLVYQVSESEKIVKVLRLWSHYE
jgi:Txe/YoeB family toxin of toxin-antitoxin system